MLVKINKDRKRKPHLRAPDGSIPLDMQVLLEKLNKEYENVVSRRDYVLEGLGMGPKRWTSFDQVLDKWLASQPLVRVPTGLETLDRICRGGLPTPRRIIITGAPGAAKTYCATVLSWILVHAGYLVGFHAVDENDEDVTVRFAQLSGHYQAECESRDPEVVNSIRTDLSKLNVRLYGYDRTIEEVAEELAEGGKEAKRPVVMVTDSLHTVRSAKSEQAQTQRQYVEGNISALRKVADKYGLTVITTAEMNRAGYANERFAAEANPLAATAEARAVEYYAETMLVLTSVPDYSSCVHVRVAKNRRHDRGEFWLQLEHTSHGLEEVPDPAKSPEAAQAREESIRQANIERCHCDAKVVVKLAMRIPRCSDADLKRELTSSGYKWGKDRFHAALDYASRPVGVDGIRLTDRSDITKPKTPKEWIVENIGRNANDSPAD